MYDLSRFARDITAAAEQLGQRPTLVGASLGGIAALAAVGRNPEIASGVVLVDVSPFLQARGARRIRDFMTAQPDGFHSLDEVAAAIAQFLPHRPRPQSLDGLLKNLRLRDGRTSGTGIPLSWREAAMTRASPTR